MESSRNWDQYNKLIRPTVYVFFFFRLTKLGHMAEEVAQTLLSQRKASWT